MDSWVGIMSRVSLIMAYDGEGRLLMGKRKDNGKWSLIGGHLNDGEDPRDGAERELFQETGLIPSSLSYLHESHEPSNGLDLYCFSAHVRGTPHGNNDPDDEFGDSLEFIDVKEGVPPRIMNNLHGPEGDTNLVRQVLQSQKMEKSASSKTEHPLGTLTHIHEPSADISAYGDLPPEFHQTESGPLTTVAFHGPSGRQMGEGHFLHTSRGLHPLWVNTEPMWQRQGIGTAIMQHAAKVTGLPFVRPKDISPAGKKLWNRTMEKSELRRRNQRSGHQTTGASLKSSESLPEPPRPSCVRCWLSDGSRWGASAAHRCKEDPYRLQYP